MTEFGGSAGAGGYPPPAFYFTVVFPNSPGRDTGFQEVSGIGTEVETEDVVEGGENRFVHRLPKAIKHGNLVLKRGIASGDSPLVTWCRAVLEGDLQAAIETRQLEIRLLDENGEPSRAWSFVNAFPVKWEVGALDAKKNEVALETIELTYNYSTRVR